MTSLPQDQDLDLVFLIDKSGSMWGSEKDTMGGFNSFIEKERKKEFNTNVTTILFNHTYQMLYKRKDINKVSDLTEEDYFVGGSTALLDAIGKTITSLDKEIDNKVLFVIMTDGFENSSIEYSKNQISNMIKNHKWEFIFIGADIDSYAEAGNIGIKKSRIANYEKSARGVEKLYTSIERATDTLREYNTLDDSDWDDDLKEFD